MAISASDSDRLFNAVLDLAKTGGSESELRHRVEDLVPRLFATVDPEHRDEVARMLDFKLSRHMTELKLNENSGADLTDHAPEFAVIDRACEVVRTAYLQPR